MRSAAVIVALAGLAAAVPQYANYDPSYPASSSEASSPDETPYPYGGYGASSSAAADSGYPSPTSAYEAPEETSTPCTTEAGHDETPYPESPYPSPTPSGDEYPAPDSSAYPAPSVTDSPVPAPDECPAGVTVTVTVTGAPYPSGGSNGGYPSSPNNGGYPQPTGTGAPVSPPASTPSQYYGAGARTNAGVALAGLGAIAAFFL